MRISTIQPDHSSLLQNRDADYTENELIEILSYITLSRQKGSGLLPKITIHPIEAPFFEAFEIALGWADAGEAGAKTPWCANIRSQHR